MSPVSRDRAEARYDHGTYARYAFGQCRCFKCKVAGTEYKHAQKAARRLPWRLHYAPQSATFAVMNKHTGQVVYESQNRDNAKRERDRLNARDRVEADNELIATQEARGHIQWLRDTGIGITTIASCSGLARSLVRRIANGSIKRTRRATADRILSVGRSALAGRVRIDATDTLALITMLLNAGYTRAALARRLGLTRANLRPTATQRHTTVSQARAIHTLYVSLMQQDRNLPRIAPTFQLLARNGVDERARS